MALEGDLRQLLEEIKYRRGFPPRAAVAVVRNSLATRGMQSSSGFAQQVAKTYADSAESVLDEFVAIVLDGAAVFGLRSEDEVRRVVAQAHEGVFNDARGMALDEMRGVEGGYTNLAMATIDNRRTPVWEHLERVLKLRRLEHAPPAHSERRAQVPAVKEWDAFICHAGEDKKTVVEPLAEALRRRGLRIWYDEWVLKIGDSLRRSIDQGLLKSRVGIVVLSPTFFKKKWPQYELDGLVQKEIAGEPVIFPVWHEVDHDEVARYSLSLADRVAGRTASGIDALAEQLVKAIQARSAPAIPLPDDLRIIPPVEIAAEVAAFSGKWHGIWDGVLHHILAVEEINSQGAIAVYAWGDSEEWRFKARYVRARAKFEGSAMILSLPRPATVTYRLRPDGALDGTYEWKGGISRAVMTRIE